MHSFYLDASALAKRFTIEPGSPVVDHLFNSASPDRMIVFNVGIAEVVSILVRKKNARRLSRRSLRQALLRLTAEIVQSASLDKIIASDSLVVAALKLIETHSVNSTDAIILRSALDLAVPLRRNGDDLVLVASDQRLLKAAQAEGLKTFNPETQSQADLAVFLGP